ncbi:teichoic acid biosynthesis protein C [Streptomyces sp. ActVer]|uniref:phage baseplate protein n=1 Tax=Streptomyces sp. ActVer TaxID=3014558 RepID=UPI0022B49C1B|nr:teichoic acid biosynthesis protein C [Streptomyces sp. ActVer]MCZ4511007.1 teichoic acid biosynthesis protein C [Streptomyces sp. ActVer]
MGQEPQTTLTRRGLLRAGTGLGIAAMGLGYGAGAAAAAVPGSQRFDLTQPSYDLYRGKSLRDVTVQQGFAFDNVNRRLFVAQRRNGTSETAGDLCVTQLDFSGNYVGHMYLTGFGHGVAFGAQGVGSSTYLWTEVEANPGGYGKRLARFQFTSGTTLSNTSSALTKYTPVSAATEHTCSIDPVNNRLIVRYHLSDGKHIAVYGLAAAANGDFSSPLANFKQPSLPTQSPTFQGYAAYGQYLYAMTGTSYEANGGVVDSEITSIDLNTGAIKQGPVLTKAGESLDFREPEGLAVYRTADGEVRLFLGFASGASGDRRSNLFYKNALV